MHEHEAGCGVLDKHKYTIARIKNRSLTASTLNPRMSPINTELPAIEHQTSPVDKLHHLPQMELAYLEMDTC